MKKFHIYFVTNKTFTLKIIQKEEFLTLTIILDKKKKNEKKIVLEENWLFIYELIKINTIKIVIFRISFSLRWFCLKLFFFFFLFTFSVFFFFWTKVKMNYTNERVFNYKFSETYWWLWGYIVKNFCNQNLTLCFLKVSYFFAIYIFFYSTSLSTKSSLLKNKKNVSYLCVDSFVCRT